MTDAEFLVWLSQPGAPRVLLVEVGVLSGGVESTRYLADRSYTTRPTDTPANTTYLGIVRGGVSFNETLPLGGNASMSSGTLELANDGRYDGWLTDIWRNRPITILLGDLRWPRAEFKPIFVGVVEDIGSRNNGSLSLTVKDKLERLNTPVTDAVLGGTSLNKDALKPVCFGEVFNITPLLVDPATERYLFHNGAAEKVVEARDKGVPVSITTTLGSGEFRLNQSLSANNGQLTVSVQGDNVGGFHSSVSQIVKRLVTGYGKASERFTDADLDLANFNAFHTANPQPVGLYLAQRTNVIAACQELTASIGASMICTRLGKLRLVRPEWSGSTLTVTPEDMLEGTFRPGTRSEVVAGVRLGYARNWTVQEEVETGIPTLHRDMFAQEYLEARSTDPTTATQYRLYGEPEQENTLLIRTADAAAEAARRLALRKVPRTTYSFTAKSNLMLLDLGQTITVRHPRHQFSAGRVAVVTGLQTNWSARTVQVEVLV